MAPVFSADGVELREASGESFSTLAKAGALTVSQQGAGLTINVDGNDVPWVASAPAGPFKRIDTRSFMLATSDLMSFYYITLPKGLPDASYEHFAAILEAAKAGQPLPAAAPLTAKAPAAAAAAAAPAPAGEPAAAGAAGAPGSNPLGDFLGALAKKAAHDTQQLGSMIAQKAQHDINALQQGGGGGAAAGKPAGA